MKKRGFLAVLMILLLMLSACGGGGGGGSDAVVQIKSASVATRQTVLSAGAPSCPSGGFLVEIGFDNNNNGVLELAEVARTESVCNGSDGVSSLISTQDEASGTNCSNGGKRFAYGLDDNNNGLLDVGEIDNTIFACNGTNGVDGLSGTNGVDGLSTLFITSQEPKGANCLSGGIKMLGGIDNNRNKFLDADEVIEISYVCNGNATEVRSLLSIVTEPAGINCQQDGKKINSGIDDNSNSILELEEIDSSIYLCDTTVTGYKNKIISSGLSHVAAIKKDGTAISAVNVNEPFPSNTLLWNNIVSIATGEFYTIGLKNDGTVVGIGTNQYGQIDIGLWRNIVAIDASETYGNLCDGVNLCGHSVGLKADGTVVATGMNISGELEVSNWTGIIDVAAGSGFTVGLKSDGTVVSTGSLDLSSWKDITLISASYDNVYGIKADGTVIDRLGWDVSGWQNIISVSGGHVHAIGLQSDGKVVGTGSNMYGQLSGIDTWIDIVAIAGGGSSSVGVKSDGTVLVTGNYATDSVLNLTNGWNLF